MKLRQVIFCLYAALVASGCTGVQSVGDRWATPGPYEVQVAENVVLFDAKQNRQVAVRVTWPDGDGPFPLVVFSHGAFCYPDQYANVTDFWVSHGYIVVFPNHLDSPYSPKMSGAAVTRLLTSRSRDMSLVLDSTSELESAVPGLNGRIDRDRAAVAGHSFGGMIAMIKSGLKMKDQRSGDPVPMADPRFQAAVIMSGVGQMTPMTAAPAVPTMASDAFQGLTGPLISSGGTLDEGNVGSGQIFPWQWRLAPYYLSPEGDKYYLAFENSDHYLGGMICRTNRGGDADPVAVETLGAAQTAFLDAYVKGDQRALGWLRSNNFSSLSDGRAEFKFK